MTNKMAHTKGEFKDGSTGWKLKHLPKTDYMNEHFEIHWSEDGECISEYVHGEANAKLIAAAPDMLLVLSLVEEFYAEIMADTIPALPLPVFNKLSMIVSGSRMAIKKATE